MKKKGRPTIYSKKLSDTLCERLAQGISLRTVCKADDMPVASAVFRWLTENDTFREQYERAKQASSEAMHEDLYEIGDQAIEASQQVSDKVAGPVVQAYKLKADNLKWSMSKMKPKKYGEKLDVTSDGKPMQQIVGMTVVKEKK